MRAYYNEIDPYAAAWLRNLIAAGHVVAGDVDERSIVDVTPADVAGYTQCHFFAGIGGWSLALRLAGWPDDRPAWTGSCPCQPFSAAGKGAGFADERHLWPAWHWLIGQSRPPCIFGEQVAAKAVEPWIDLVQADLEALGYAFDAIPFPAASVGAPHIRDRLSFVADARSQGLEEWRGYSQESEGSQQWWCPDAGDRQLGGMVDAAGEQARLPGRARQPRGTLWSDVDRLPCRDGKARPVEPGTFPLAHGIPGRVGRLRAYGNAIVPQAQAEFIAAFTGRYAFLI